LKAFLLPFGAPGEFPPCIPAAGTVVRIRVKGIGQDDETTNRGVLFGI
jgi:hypothetical protein